MKTVKSLLYSFVGKFLDLFALELRRKDPLKGRHTLRGTLEHARKLGFSPAVVIDAGAARGTRELYETFPSATHLIIEPLEENRPYLERIARGLNDAEYICAAAAGTVGTATFNVHPDFDGSSLYREDEEGDVNGVPRTVTTVTLDDLCRERGLTGAALIKIDVQGAELDVLRGAAEVLQRAEYVVLEATLFEFFMGAPRFSDVIFFMKERGFVVYDLLDYGYRPLDGAMSQVDLVFVKEDGMFRKYHFYATREQREAQNRLFRKDLSSVGGKR